jgi:LacI family transcriptional regulator
METTIHDIARAAGVSIATVSRSLNDSPLVSDKTKKRIKKIADEYKYEINSTARTLSTRRTDTIGIIYSNNMKDFNYALFHSSLLDEIRKAFETKGMNILTAFPKNETTGKSNIVNLVGGHKVDGLLLICPDITDEDWEYMLLKRFPVVILHYKPLISKITDTLSGLYPDNFYGGKISAEYLLSLGHRNILTMITTDTDAEHRERFEGFIEEYESRVGPYNRKYLLDIPITGESGYNGIMENRELLSEITAVCVLGSDLMAMGAKSAIQELGYSIPDDISLIGYDGTQIGNFTFPPLTTVYQPRDLIAEVALEHLINLIDTNYSDSEKLDDMHLLKIIKPEILERKSCRSLEPKE